MKRYLENMKCPNCGYTGHFRIRGNVWIDVYETSLSINTDKVKAEWTENSWCMCPNCSYVSEYRNFVYSETFFKNLIRRIKSWV